MERLAASHHRKSKVSECSNCLLFWWGVEVWGGESQIQKCFKTFELFGLGGQHFNKRRTMIRGQQYRTFENDNLIPRGQHFGMFNDFAWSRDGGSIFSSKLSNVEGGGHDASRFNDFGVNYFEILTQAFKR